MVYDYNMLAEKLVAENNSTISIDSYIKESFLIESSAESLHIKKMIDDLRNDIKNGKEVTKEDFEEIYNEIKALSKTDIKEALKYYVMLLFTITSFVSFIVSAALLNNGLYKAALIAGVIAIFTSCISSVISLSIDPVSTLSGPYKEMIRQEASLRVEYRKVKASGDKKEIESFEKIIKAMEDMKKTYKKELKEKYFNQSNESTSLLEWTGDEVKHEEFVQVLEDIDNLCKFNMEKINLITRYAEDIIKETKKCKNEKQLKDFTLDLRNWPDKLNKEVDAIDEVFAPLQFTLLAQYCKKFQNKYSELSMTAKKDLCDKLTKYLTKLEEIKTRYRKNGDLSKDFDAAYINIEDINPVYSDSVVKYFNGLFRYGVSEINYTIDDINFIIKTLNITGIEKSLIYKISKKIS